MTRFHSLKVADVRQETKDCVSVAFDIPPDLKKEYAFIQGQYVTLKLKVNGEEIRRSYSICSSPVADHELRVAIKRVKGGKGSNFINDQLKKGDAVEVMTPMGNFYSTVDPSNRKNYFLFAGGSGITPMLSIIRTVLHTEKDSQLTLFYGNLDEESTIFYKELNALVASAGGKLKVHYVFDKPKSTTDALHTGMLTVEKVHELYRSFCGNGMNHEYFVCGPGPMMENVKTVVQEHKVPSHQFHIEYFTSVSDAPVKEDSGPVVHAKVTVSMYGMETTFDLASNGKSVLDAALEAGVDVPFACKGAVCCTCRGKVLDGKVKMDRNFALTDAEVDEGYVLTCQSHPITEKVRIDYDS